MNYTFIYKRFLSQRVSFQLFLRCRVRKVGSHQLLRSNIGFLFHILITFSTPTTENKRNLDMIKLMLFTLTLYK